MTCRKARSLLLALLALNCLAVHAQASTDDVKEEPKIQGTISVKGRLERDYASLAKISLQQAMRQAQREFPGKIVEAALEDEDGFLVYAIEIASNEQGKKEVLIDAGSGKTLLLQDEEEPGKKARSPGGHLRRTQ